MDKKSLFVLVYGFHHTNNTFSSIHLATLSDLKFLLHIRPTQVSFYIQYWLDASRKKYKKKTIYKKVYRTSFESSYFRQIWDQTGSLIKYEDLKMSLYVLVTYNISVKQFAIKKEAPT